MCGLYYSILTVQEKSEEKCSSPLGERLKALKIKREWGWSDVAAAFDLSKSQIFKVLSGKGGLGDVKLRRLEILEVAAGIKEEEPKSFPEPQPNHGLLRALPQQVDDVIEAMEEMDEKYQALQRSVRRLKDAQDKQKPLASSSPEDVGKAALKKGVASVRKGGVVFGRSRKAASTSGKTSSPT